MNDTSGRNTPAPTHPSADRACEWPNPRSGSIRGGLVFAALTQLISTTYADTQHPMAHLGDQWFHQINVDQLEVRDTAEGQPLAWDANAWIGSDLNRLALKTEGKRLDGVTEEAELQVLYSRAVGAFWNAHAGWRHDFLPHPDRDWLAIGIAGTAPWFVDIDATLFIGESGRSALRLSAEYDFRITQQLILTPDIEIDIHGKDDPDTQTGSGLSEIEAGLRLRYEIHRKFAPYLGLVWSGHYGETADYSRAAGKDPRQWQVVAGLRFWF